MALRKEGTACPRPKTSLCAWARFVGYTTSQLVQLACHFQGTWTILPGLASSLVSYGNLGKCKETPPQLSRSLAQDGYRKTPCIPALPPQVLLCRGEVQMHLSICCSETIPHLRPLSDTPDLPWLQHVTDVSSRTSLVQGNMFGSTFHPSNCPQMLNETQEGSHEAGQLRPHP